MASPFTRATISGSCAGMGFTGGGASSAAAGGGVAWDVVGLVTGLACGLASAAVFLEQAGSITIANRRTARRTGDSLPARLRAGAAVVKSARRDVKRYAAASAPDRDWTGNCAATGRS